MRRDFWLQKFADLDKHSEEHNFPFLGNLYFEMADARLTVFRSEEDWALLFEIVAWSNRESEFGCDVFAYGTCVYPEGLKTPGKIVLSIPKESPIVDPQTGECIASWDKWVVTLKGKDVTFQPSREEYALAGIKVPSGRGPGSIKEADILRFLVFKLGHVFFSSDQELLGYVPDCRATKKFIQVTDWEHPDLQEQKPTQSQTMRTLMDAISSGDPSRFDPGKSNTDWKKWVEYWYPDQ